jgi:GNAT superfamily N-acetyltransferase
MAESEYVTFYDENAYAVVAHNTILTLEAFEQGKGYGSALLARILEYMREKGFETVELDDMSDRARKPHNIYTKFGFKYVHEYGPEMIFFLGNNK